MRLIGWERLGREEEGRTEAWRGGRGEHGWRTNGKKVKKILVAVKSLKKVIINKYNRWIKI